MKPPRPLDGINVVVLKSFAQLFEGTSSPQTLILEDFKLNAIGTLRMIYRLGNRHLSVSGSCVHACALF